VGVIVLIGIGVGAAAVASTSVPSPNEVATSEATIVLWSDGTTELGRLGEATRRSVELATIPQDVQRAVLAAEDRSFYEHGGISPAGLIRAAWNNVVGGATQGGSTVTQQYAKNAYLTQDRSWNRKIREALLAFKLETVVSKDQILEDYLNTIYFGRGAYGIEAASIAYFGVPVAQLDVSQGAVLASIIKSPNGLAPEENLDALQARWSSVISAMVQQGWITQQEADSAEFPKIKKLKAKNRLGGQTGFLLEAVTEQLITMGFDETEIQRGGLRIVSTFDKQAQESAVKAVEKEGPTTGTEGLRIGLASVRPGTGEVVAMYGGPDFVNDQINNATRPFAQAGSTFKPFALAAAIEQGIPLSSRWNGDSPATVNGYTFNNYGNRSYGTVTLLQATERSINSAYVELESDIGVEQVADAALRAGIPQDTPGLNLDQLDLTFVLGTASPSGLDVANAYATFASSGVRATTTFINQVVGPNGGVLYERSTDTTAAFDSDTANTVTYALNKTVMVGTALAARDLQRPAAAKTGTTDDNKSAWFAGYTPDLATAVLMAKEDAEGMPISMSGTGGLDTVTGGSFPAAIWTAYMAGALEGTPVAQFPAPPAGVNDKLDCPMVLPEDGTQIPMGCPTPGVVEFQPSAGASALIPSGSAMPADSSSPGPQEPSEAAPEIPGDTGPTPQPTQPPPTGQPTEPPTPPPAETGPPQG
jgi:membrane peptidoglycan carboxypeptidase